MTIGRIVLRSLRQHALSTTVTAFSIALAGGLLMSVWSVKTQSQATFTGVNAGFDAVLGARGSKLQLVLNSIFHLEASLKGNLGWFGLSRHPKKSERRTRGAAGGRRQLPRLSAGRDDA